MRKRWRWQGYRQMDRQIIWKWLAYYLNFYQNAENQAWKPSPFPCSRFCHIKHLDPALQKRWQKVQNIEWKIDEYLLRPARKCMGEEEEACGHARVPPRDKRTPEILSFQGRASFNMTSLILQLSQKNCSILWQRGIIGVWRKYCLQKSLLCRF